MPASSISPSPAPGWSLSAPTQSDTNKDFEKNRVAPDVPAARTSGDPSTLPPGPLGKAKHVLHKKPDPAASSPAGHRPANEPSQIDRTSALVVEQTDNADILRQQHLKEMIGRFAHDALERIAKLSSDETQRGQTERNQLHG